MTNRQGRWGWLLKPTPKNSGQALVELALTAPLFFLLLVGAAELAHVSYVLIEVTNAAEAAVRYGAQNNTTAKDVTGMQLAAATDAGNINLDIPSVTSTCGCVDGTQMGSSCASFSCTTGAAPVQTLYVTTSINFDPLIHIPGLPTTYTLYGFAHQKVLY